MDPLWAGLVGAVAGIASGIISSRAQLSQHRAERFTEREQKFETAQFGYRLCYRKFLVNVAACYRGGRGIPLDGQDTVDATTLLDNFWEASFTGDPTVIRELDAYWPAEARANGDLPAKTPPNALLEAMRLHGVRSLKEHDKAQRGFVAA